jgi:peptide/nickel transport system ATP-binding protein
MTALLTVEDLRVSFPGRHGPVEVVRGVSFALGRERLAIVGESGSGKSLTGRAILRLVRPPGRVQARSIRLGETELTRLNERQMRRVRGARVSMVMQDPKFSLNPVMTIGAQIAEVLWVHGRVRTAAEARARVRDMLARVRIDDPDRVAALYPHQVSGGMGQRAMIAMMLAPEPDILIADEPTSALDVSVQAQVIDLIDGLIRETGMGLILISHDLALVSRACDRILVMNAGQVVEECRAADLSRATHPYTRGLLASVPRMDETRAVLPTLDRSAWAGT